LIPDYYRKVQGNIRNILYSRHTTWS